jgi:thiamine-phosphate pyrophosphorylase
MNTNGRLRGLYPVTDASLTGDSNLVAQVAQALRGGAQMVQYRDKTHAPQARMEQAGELLKLCRAVGIPLIINDDLELAERLGADGVHLGRDDPDPLLARRTLGPRAIVGVSCYDSLQRAVEAEQAGADYVAFGRFFASSSKPQAVQATPGLLRQARSRLALPIVAIGGITPENGASLVAAGADMLAVIHGVFGQPDIRLACERFTRLFETSEVTPP